MLQAIINAELIIDIGNGKCNFFFKNSGDNLISKEYMSEKRPLLKSLLDKIRSGDPEAEGLLYLYARSECYPSIGKYLYNRGASEDDICDVFQDAVLVLMDAVKGQKFNLKTLRLRSQRNQLCSYLMGIAKNLWKKELRWRNRGEVKQEAETEEALSFDLLPNLVKDTFASLGADCRQVLLLYFKENCSPKIIATQLGKKTEEIKSLLSGCIDKLLDDIGQLMGGDRQGELQELMNQSMEDLEERCRKILQLFYYKKTSMKDMAEILGYANAHTVVEQKRRCLIRLNYAVVNRLMNYKKT